MKYYIGDLHLYNRNQTNEGINYDHRPFDTQEEFVKYVLNAWNSKITNGDIVYILGDNAFKGNNEKLIETVSKLKGHKVLIKGNHDDISDYRYAKLFDEICDYKEIIDSADGKSYRLVLSHYPILFWKNQGKDIHLYAHVHNTYEDDYFQKCIHDMNNSDLFRHKKNGNRVIAINVGCMKEYMNYEPRTLKELLEGYDKELNIEDADLIKFHPGYYLKEYMDKHNLSLDDLSKRVRISKDDIESLIDKKINLTDEMIVKFARFFNTSTTLWINLNEKYKKEGN